MELFTDAEPANLGDRIEGCSSLHNLPFDVVGDVVPGEISDICTECGPSVFHILGVDVRHMLVVSGLHGVVSTTSVGLPMAGVSPGDSCLVHQVVHLAANAREYLTGFRHLQRST